MQIEIDSTSGLESLLDHASSPDSTKRSPIIIDLLPPELPHLREPYLVVDRRGRIIPGSLPEDQAYRASGLEFPRIDMNLDMNVTPRYIPTTDRNIHVVDVDKPNRDGYDAEDKVGQILGRLDSVKGVIQTPKDAPLVDLSVLLNEEFPIRIIGVQVKSSPRGVQSFFSSIDVGSNSINDDGRGAYLARREWMARENVVVINGGVRKEGQVSDTYIVQKFARDVNLLIWRKAARDKFGRRKLKVV